MSEGPTKTETLNGGVNVRVKMRSGLMIDVLVRQLKNRELRKFGVLLDDPCALAEMLCDKPDGWSDELELESMFELVREGRRVNHTPFSVFMGAMVEHNKWAAETMAPHAEAANAAAALVRETTRTSLPKPASSPG
jgi:hypothetical protein